MHREIDKLMSSALLAAATSEPQRQEIARLIKRLHDGVDLLQELKSRPDEVGVVARALLAELHDASREKEDTPTAVQTH